MIFRQILHEDLGCASYLIGDAKAGVAAVVDPKLEIAEYLALADQFGVRIAHVLETHNHADHVSGHGRLVAATGATVHVHRLNAPDYPHAPFGDGWELELGRVVVRAIHTPGHRPEHTAFALVDTERGPEPWAVLTGDSLFVGDVARPDLAIEGREGARELHRSLHERLLVLPDSCEVWPGHLGGSMCGGPTMSLKGSSTIGYERAHNPALQTLDPDRFVVEQTESLGAQPPNFTAIVGINHGPLRAAAPEPPALTPGEVARWRDERRALLVDVRADAEYDAGHVPGTVAVPTVRGGFGTRLAWIARAGEPVVLIGSDEADARRAVALARAIGVDEIAGVLAGGMTAWYRERRELATTERVPLTALPERIAATPGLQILDVREPAEWRNGMIAGSAGVPWHALREAPAAVDLHAPIAVVCGSGQRAAVAAGLLQRLGATEVLHVVDGGVPDWERAGQELVRA